MATFVLVHGTHAGGWAWQRLAPLLREAGHEVYAPTLTGLGERVHLARLDVGLETYVQDVANVLRFEDLHDVVLVGSSFGGMVVAGVADRSIALLERPSATRASTSRSRGLSKSVGIVVSCTRGAATAPSSVPSRTVRA